MPTFAKRTGLIVAAAVLAAAACGGSTNKTSSSSPPAVPPSASGPTTAATTTTPLPSLPGIPLLMLSLRDMPKGWTVNSYATSSSSFSCFNSHRRPAGEMARSEVSFRRGTKAAPAIAEAAGAFEPARAVEVYAELVRAFTSCKDVAITTSGHRIEGTIRALSLAPVGDASRGWQMAFSAQSGGTTVTVDLDVVVFRVGSYDGQLIASDLGAPDITLVQSLAARAAAKFGDSTT